MLAEDFAQFGTPTRYFSYTPTPSYCVSNITNNGDPNTFSQGLYNKDVSTGGNVVSCLPEFVLK